MLMDGGLGENKVSVGDSNDAESDKARTRPNSLFECQKRENQLPTAMTRLTIISQGIELMWWDGSAIPDLAGDSRGRRGAR
jgi:hypothetical protein